MKATAALQLLTAVMSSSGQDPWQTDDMTVTTDLDLGACLDVANMNETGHNLYSDTETAHAQQHAWVDNVIDFTSSTELTSSGDQMGIVPEAEDALLTLGQAFSGQGGSVLADDSQNAMFITVTNDSSLLDLAQLGADLKTAALTNTTSSTVDLTSLGEFMCVEVDSAPSRSSEFGGNIPNSLWNIDFAGAGKTAADHTVPLGRGSGEGSVSVKETLRSRLYSRSSVTSSSLDASDVPCSSSSRSLPSPTSSLTQSMEDDEEDPEESARCSFEKREKNRLAAQKCRDKKRVKTESLQKDVSRLEERQERLKKEVRKLRDERENLEEIINVHGMVCPKMRKISDS